jgi:ribose transport system substrate-binding protein
MTATSVDRRNFLAAAGAAAAALGLAACANPSGGAGGTNGTASSKPRTGNGQYVEVLELTSLPYFIDHKLGMDLAARWLGVKTKFVGPSNLDLNGMISTLEQTIAQNVSGIVVVGFDPALGPAIDKAISAGIPTVTVDADVPDSKRLCFLGTGNVQAGRLGATELVKQIGGSGKVAIVTRTGQSNLEERVRGYKEVLQSKGIDLVAVLNDDSDSNKAAAAVSATLRRVPDLSGVACVEAAGGVGAATAVKEAGKQGQVKIVSMDRDAETLQKIKEGTIQASVAQKSALMTFLAVTLLHSSQTIDITITNNNKTAGVSPLPTLVDTGVELVSKSNVDDWIRR